jgi:hypothetical protein
MSESDDAFGGDLFGGFLDTMKPGTSVSGVGRLRYRQGNNVRDWAGPGGSKYLARDWHMQCGAFKKLFTVRKSGGFEITFPIPFGGTPLVLVSPSGTWPPFEEIRYSVEIQSAAVVEIYWWSTNFITRVYVNWFALGPIGL